MREKPYVHFTAETNQYRAEFLTNHILFLFIQYVHKKEGGIALPEFITMILDQKRSVEIEEKYAFFFRKADNGKGYISEKNLFKAIKQIEEFEGGMEEIVVMISECNRDFDGNICYRDFIKLLRKDNVLLE